MRFSLIIYYCERALIGAFVNSSKTLDSDSPDLHQKKNGAVNRVVFFWGVSLKFNFLRTIFHYIYARFFEIYIIGTASPSSSSLAAPPASPVPPLLPRRSFSPVAPPRPTVGPAGRRRPPLQRPWHLSRPQRHGPRPPRGRRTGAIRGPPTAPKNAGA